MDRLAVVSVLAIILAQTDANKPATSEELSKVLNCTLEGCAIWDSVKGLNTRNLQVEFTHNQKKYILFVSKPSLERPGQIDPGRIDFEVRPEGTSDISRLESFGCSLDGSVPFKDSSMPYGFSGKRPDVLFPPFFRDPENREYWWNRFNEAFADTLAFMDSHPK